MKLFWGKRSWRQENDQTWINFFLFLQNCPFWTTYIKKNKHVYLLVHSHSLLLVHIRFTPNEGAEDVLWIDIICKKSDHGKRPSSVGPTSWSIGLSNEQGEPTTIYMVWAIPGWSSRLKDNHPYFKRNLWNIRQINISKNQKDHVM